VRGDLGRLNYAGKEELADVMMMAVSRSQMGTE
jgi:hypothetical protein